MIELLKLLGYTIPIIAALVALYKFARNIEKRFDKIDSHFEKIDNNLNKNTVMTLKSVILDERLSLDERISAGEQYVQLGGNGFIKSYYEKLVEMKLKEV